MATIANHNYNFKVRGNERLLLVQTVVFLFGLFVVGRLAYLQIWQQQQFTNRANSQQSTVQKIYPVRGLIYLKIKSTDDQTLLYPLASNQELYTVFADPPLLKDQINYAVSEVLKIVGPVLPQGKVIKDFTPAQLTDLTNQEITTLTNKLTGSQSHYQPLRDKITKEQVEQIKKLGVNGLGFVSKDFRYYPAQESFGQLLGYVGYKNDVRQGFCGLEGYWNKELTGQLGEIKSEKDALGRLIAVGDLKTTNSHDGSSLVLTIDQTIQHFACQKLATAVQKHQATGGTVIIQNPKTGAIIALCNYPDFNPGEYNKVKDIKIFNNPAIFFEYEPGSVFKPFTLAAAINEGKVTADSVFNDDAPVKIGPETIENSDKLNHGWQTMTQVLEKSLNTGAIYAMRQIGPKIFTDYVKKFGFGQLSGIDLATEITGNIKALKEKGEIYYATASFGQGISATPLQLVAAYSALANGGVLMKPYVVQEIIDENNHAQTINPKVVQEVVSTKTAKMIGTMLVSVVQNGHGKAAGVPGYLVGGKTGTAQIPLANGGGYEATAHIGTFIGYAPVDNPKFTMIVKIDRPQDVQFAESSAAPLFGEIAKFILNYYQIVPSSK
ncbi:MAG: penicillin-binding protein 2 [Candidatus Buchananbacteria bacterium]